MTDSNSTTTIRSGGMGLLGWLFIIFLILKLNPGGYLDSPVADWSWWWVTAPLWGAFAIAAVALLAIGVVYLVANALDARTARKNRKLRAQREAERLKRIEENRNRL